MLNLSCLLTSIPSFLYPVILQILLAHPLKCLTFAPLVFLWFSGLDPHQFMPGLLQWPHLLVSLHPILLSYPFCVPPLDSLKTASNLFLKTPRTLYCLECPVLFASISVLIVLLMVISFVKTESNPQVWCRYSFFLPSYSIPRISLFYN